MTTIEQLIQQRDQLLDALIAMRSMPDYDGTAETSRARLRAKNKAKQAINLATQGILNDTQRTIHSGITPHQIRDDQGADHRA